MTIFKYFNTRLFFGFSIQTSILETELRSRSHRNCPVFENRLCLFLLRLPTGWHCWHLSFLIRRKYTIIRGSSNFKKNSPASLALLHELAWEANQTRSKWEVIFHLYTTQWRCYWIYVTYKGIGTRPFKKDRVYLKNNTIIQNGCQLVVHQNNT